MVGVAMQGGAVSNMTALAATDGVTLSKGNCPQRGRRRGQRADGRLDEQRGQDRRCDVHGGVAASAVSTIDVPGRVTRSVGLTMMGSIVKAFTLG